jgi:hypothetical protein
MRRLTLKLATAALTFSVGVAATAVYFVRRAPAPAVAPVEIGAGRRAGEGVTPSCFPGRAVPLGGAEGRGPWRYFPRGTFDPRPERERFLVEWYEKNLAAMHEPALSVRQSEPFEAYRFLWLRSFHDPVAVRVWREGGGRFISVKALDIRGVRYREEDRSFETGKLIAENSRELRPEEWAEFTRLLERACYWNLDARRDIGGCDGAQWILEGAREGRYHAVDWWTPQAGAYREACLYLLKLSGLVNNVAGEDVY